MELLLQRRLKYDIAAARTFSGLMDIYEQNYIHLRRLIPDFATIGTKAVSTASGCMDLHYECLQRSRYTTVFILTYRFEKIEPNLQIRVYHDARVAEALAGNIQSAHVGSALKVPGLLHTDLQNVQSKWALNRFLQKWLSFTLKQGHLFVPNSYCAPWLPNIRGNFETVKRVVISTT